MATTPQETPAAHAARIWDRLADFTREWFWDPDLEAMRTVMAVSCAHYHLQADPLWLFLVGPPGCGKTTLGINPYLKLERAHLMGDVTPYTFISGWKDNPGLLHQWGNSIIMYFKDFTTILSKRPEAKSEIISQMREMADGAFSRNTGTKLLPPWVGKVTIIAAVTGAIEQHWSVQRELGERFMMLRWPRGDGPRVAEYARKQRGHERQITEGLQELVMELTDVRVNSPAPATVPPVMAARFDLMAEALAILRGAVPHSNHGSGEVNGLPTIEAPSRISKALNWAVGASASLLRREVTSEDATIARRLVMDSVPSIRQRLISCIPPEGDIGSAELVAMSKLPVGSLDHYAKDLAALNVINIGHNQIQNTYSFTEEFTQLLRRSGLVSV